MRLSEIRKIIIENKPFLSIKSEEYPQDSSYKRVRNIPELLTHLDELSKVPSLMNYIETMRSKTPTLSSIHTPDIIIVKTDELNLFHSYVENILRKCDTIIELANSILPATEKNMLCIKIPDSATLIETSEILKDFSSLFDELLSHENIDGDIKLYGAEAGSFWIYILMSAGLTKIVNTIVDSIYKMYSKYLSIKLTRLQLEEYAISNAALADLEKLLHTMCEKEVESLINDHELYNNDIEGRTRLTLRIENIARLVVNGVRVSPSLNAPPEEYNKTLEKISQIDDLLEKIEQLSLPQRGDKELPPPSDQDE